MLKRKREREEAIAFIPTFEWEKKEIKRINKCDYLEIAIISFKFLIWIMSLIRRM